LRLIKQAQLLAVERTSQGVLSFQPREGGFTQRLVEDFDVPATALLGSILTT
jgi:hypothetical protein